MIPAFDWRKLGQALHAAALDAHEGDVPPVDLAYSFLLDNPDCFVRAAELAVLNAGRPEAELVTSDDVAIGNVEWPAGMPSQPNIELIAGYYGVGEPLRQVVNKRDGRRGVLIYPGTTICRVLWEGESRPVAAVVEHLEISQ